MIISLEDYQRLEKLKAEQKREASLNVLSELIVLGKNLPKTAEKTNALAEIDKMWQEWSHD